MKGFPFGGRLSDDLNLLSPSMFFGKVASIQKKSSGTTDLVKVQRWIMMHLMLLIAYRCPKAGNNSDDYKNFL